MNKQLYAFAQILLYAQDYDFTPTIRSYNFNSVYFSLSNEKESLLIGIEDGRQWVGIGGYSDEECRVYFSNLRDLVLRVDSFMERNSKDEG